MARRPHDSVGRCPYSAPVRRFHLCPAYEPKVSPVSDSQGRKLGAVMACHHLTIGHGEQQGRFYPRCTIGGPEAIGWRMASTDGNGQVGVGEVGVLGRDTSEETEVEAQQRLL